MKHGCDNCKYRSFPATRSPCDNCIKSGDKYSEWTSPTNADHIRSMTDEELSAFLCNMGQECYRCIATDYCSHGHTGMLDLLKDEVKE